MIAENNNTLSEATQTLYRLTVDLSELEKLDASLTSKQKSVCELLGSTGGASLKEICYFTGVTGAVVKTLERKNLVEQVEYEVYRSPLEGKSSEKKPPFQKGRLFYKGFCHP